MLKKGDPCRVRLHTGEVVEAVYVLGAGHKDHYVMINDKLVCVWHHKNGRPSAETEICYECANFVGNPCVLVPIGGEK